MPEHRGQPSPAQILRMLRWIRNGQIGAFCQTLDAAFRLRKAFKNGQSMRVANCPRHGRKFDKQRLFGIH